MSFYVAVYDEPDRARLSQIDWIARTMGAIGTVTIGGLAGGRYPHFADIRDAKAHLPGAWVPLELTPRSVPLAEFTHPQEAVYLLGAQIHTIPVSALRQLPRPVVVETHVGRRAVIPTPAVAGIVLHHRLTQVNSAAYQQRAKARAEILGVEV